MVDRKSKLSQRELSNLGQTSNSNKGRCFTRRLKNKLMAMRTGGKWSVKEKKLHILERLAVKNGIIAFTKVRTINAIPEAAV